MILPIYEVNSAVILVVYIVAGIVSAFIAGVIVAFIIYRETMIIRASSRKFTALMLLGLLLMSISSILYAFRADAAGATGNSTICSSRIWCSFTSLMIVLFILIVKAARIMNIFGGNELRLKSNVTDGWMARVITTAMAIQFVFNIVFQSLQLQMPTLSTGSNSSLGYRVWECSSSSQSFNIWVGFQIAYICVILCSGAFLAFRTRLVPVAFNESQHIFASLTLCIFFLIIIVPLDFLISNSLESAVVVQGLGQSFLALCLTLINFGPKVYHIAAGNANNSAMAQMSVFSAKQQRQKDERIVTKHSSGSQGNTSSSGKTSTSYPLTTGSSESGIGDRVNAGDGSGAFSAASRNTKKKTGGSSGSTISEARGSSSHLLTA